MNLANFETDNKDECIISIDAPEDGYEANTKYHVTVSSTVQDGVGHLLVPTTGKFLGGFPEFITASTQGSQRFQTKTWEWTSDSQDRLQILGICAGGREEPIRGYATKAWVAPTLEVYKKGATKEKCSYSNSTAVDLACWCSATDTATCVVGSCCYVGGTCGECAKPTPTPTPSPTPTPTPSPPTAGNKGNGPSTGLIIGIVAIAIAVVVVAGLLGRKLCAGRAGSRGGGDGGVSMSQS